MTPTELVREAHRLGITLAPNGDKLRVEAPVGTLSPELRQALFEHKSEILARLRQRLKHPVGDGQSPPLDRPPATREETARLTDYLGDPVAFSSWFARLMGREE